LSGFRDNDFADFEGVKGRFQFRAVADNHPDHVGWVEERLGGGFYVGYV
jgi:hypothetical protein